MRILKQRKALDLPVFRDSQIAVELPDAKEVSTAATLAEFLGDVMRRDITSSRMFSLDENASNGFAGVYTPA